MKPEEIKKGLEALDKMQFFMGQRAGRELWMNKPHDVQEKDLESFNRDVEIVRGLIQQLELERDALLEIVRNEADCKVCKHLKEECNGDCSLCEIEEPCACKGCTTKDIHWEYAGIKEDNP